MSFIAGSPLSATGGRVGQQCHLAGVLDRDGDVTLVLDAVAGHPTRADLAAVGDELAEQGGVLVVDTGRLLLAELAKLLLGLAEYGLGHCGASSSEARLRRNGRLVVWKLPAFEAGRRAPVLPTGGWSEGWLVVADAGGAPRVAGGCAAALTALATGRGGRSGPRVVGRRGLAAALGLAATLAATTGVAASAALAAGAVDLGGRELQRGADLVDLDLEDGPLLTFAGLVGPGLEPALDDHPHAPLQRLGDVLRRLPPDGAAQEHRLAVDPLVGVLVEAARGRGHREVGDRGARGREAQLGVVGEVADHGDDGLACHEVSLSVPFGCPTHRCRRHRRWEVSIHRRGGPPRGPPHRTRRPRRRGYLLSGRMTLVRRIDSFSVSWRSSSLTVSGSALRVTTA